MERSVGTVSELHGNGTDSDMVSYIGALSVSEGGKKAHSDSFCLCADCDTDFIFLC